MLFFTTSYPFPSFFLFRVPNFWLYFSRQGERDEELPEVLLGVARIRKLDVTLADYLGASEELEVKFAG